MKQMEREIKRLKRANEILRKAAAFRPGRARPPTQIMDLSHNNKDRYGVEAICRILPIAPSTYYRTLDLTLTIQNIERNEIYMMSIMLNKLNEFGRSSESIWCT